MMYEKGKRTAIVALMLIWFTAVAMAGGQPDLEVEIPPAFLEQRGEEWVQEFRAQLLQALAATPVASDAVRMVLRFTSAQNLPDDPGEAAGRMTQAIQFADERLRRGDAPAAVTAKAARSVGSDRGPGSAAGAAGRGRTNASSALERVEEILEDVRTVGRPAAAPGGLPDGIESGAPPGQPDSDNPVDPPDGGRPDR